MTLDEAAEAFAKNKNEKGAKEYRRQARIYYSDGMISLEEFTLIYDITFEYLGRIAPGEIK